MDFDFAGGSLFYVPIRVDGPAVKTEIVMKREETHRRGQGLVEFALVVPLFLVLLLGMVEFGRAWMTKNILTGAAREAVRLAAVQADNVASQSVATARADNVLNSAGIHGASVSFSTYETPEPGIQVSVGYQFPLIVGGNFGIGRFFGGGDYILLTSTTSMRRERY